MCNWCGDTHGPTVLCQRAQRGLTRRSFCFLFGAGVAGLALSSRSGTIEAALRSLAEDCRQVGRRHLYINGLFAGEIPAGAIGFTYNTLTRPFGHWNYPQGDPRGLDASV